MRESSLVKRETSESGTKYVSRETLHGSQARRRTALLNILLEREGKGQLNQWGVHSV
jgi:hypothetical protein